MKKIFVFMLAVALTMGLSFSVQAANQCQVTLTSPTIVKTGCEKVGSVTFSFDAGTVLQGGDWWYMDLPSGATLCSSIDYFIFNAGMLNINVAGANVIFGAVNQGLFGGANVAAGTTDGPFTVTNLGGGAALAVTGDLALRIQGSQGSQRVWLRMHDDAGTANVVESITVGAATTLDLKILDGALHVPLGQPAVIARDSDGDGLYGDNPLPGSDFLVGPVPDINNSLCANSEQMSGSLMFVSFASLNDFITFSGDAQIAHAAAAQPLALAFCKGETTGQIEIGAQGACDFDFETPMNYCPLGAFAVQGGNMIYIESTSTFGDPGDKYDLRIYSDTSGVYFQAGAAVAGYAPTEDKCAVGAGNLVVLPGAFVLYNSSGTANATPPDNSCSVPSANRVDELQTQSGAITLIDGYDALGIDLSTMVYDTSIIGDGTEVDIRIALHKYPCGEIFTGTHTIGTFVTTCPVGAAGTNLLFPFFPPMDGSIPNWWGGFMVVNGSTAAGTAALTFTEDDGDVATYTTPSIGAAGQWNAGAFADLLTQVTPDAGNTGTFGDANFCVQAVCTFNLGAGFAFTGNSIEGTGYTAYSSDW